VTNLIRPAVSDANEKAAGSCDTRLAVNNCNLVALLLDGRCSLCLQQRIPNAWLFTDATTRSCLFRLSGKVGVDDPSLLPPSTTNS
jgi:hypothetical protein